jgi:hypothetical protein
MLPGWWRCRARRSGTARSRSLASCAPPISLAKAARRRTGLRAPGGCLRIDHRAAENNARGACNARKRSSQALNDRQLDDARDRAREPEAGGRVRHRGRTGRRARRRRMRAPRRRAGSPYPSPPRSLCNGFVIRLGPGRPGSVSNGLTRSVRFYDHANLRRNPAPPKVFLDRPERFNPRRSP